MKFGPNYFGKNFLLIGSNRKRGLKIRALVGSAGLYTTINSHAITESHYKRNNLGAASKPKGLNIH